MTWTRRYIAGLPELHLRTQLEFDGSPIDHDVGVLEPISIPLFAIDLNGLNKVTVVVVQILRRDMQDLAAVDVHFDVGEPG